MISSQHARGDFGKMEENQRSWLLWYEHFLCVCVCMWNHLKCNVYLTDVFLGVRRHLRREALQSAMLERVVFVKASASPDIHTCAMHTLYRGRRGPCKLWTSVKGKFSAEGDINSNPRGTWFSKRRDTNLPVKIPSLGQTNDIQCGRGTAALSNDRRQLCTRLCLFVSWPYWVLRQ